MKLQDKMKTKNLILIATLLIISIFLVSCNNIPQNKNIINTSENSEASIEINSDSSCEDLLNNFDNVAENFNTSVCFGDDIPEFWVAGELISAEYNYQEWYQQYNYILKFKGIAKTKTITLIMHSEEVVYELNKYYKFDYGKICNNMMSMANSGAFSYTQDFLIDIECNV